MIAERINKYLIDHGIKQRWLADRLQVPASTLNEVLRGRISMKADMFIKICQILGVAPETFTEVKA